MQLALYICVCWLCMSEGARVAEDELDVAETAFPFKDEVCGAITHDANVTNSVVSSVCAVQKHITGFAAPNLMPQWMGRMVDNSLDAVCQRTLRVAWDQAIGCVCEDSGVKLDEHMCPYFYTPCEPPKEKCNNNPENIEKSVKFLTVQAIRDTACLDSMHDTPVGTLCIPGWDATWHIVWNAYDYLIGCVCDVATSGEGR